MSYRASLLSFLFILLSTNAMAQDDAALNAKIEQLKQLLNEVPAAIAQKNNSAVMLGSDQAAQAMPNALLEQGAKSLIAMIDAANQAKVKTSITGLSWVQSDSSALSAAKLFNAGNASEVNICRASFLGDHGYGKAVYPGLLTANGCLISYAGYAFTIAKYDVLTGNNPDLKWIPYQTVKSAMQSKKPEPKKIENTCVQGQCYGPVMFGVQMNPVSIIDTKVNGSSSVSGGYDNSGAVLICRANYNNKETVGKLVGNVCDISSAEKEVSVADNFDLLYFGKAAALPVKKEN